MLKAGALFYAILISFIITTLSSSLILLAYFNDLYISQTIIQEQIKSNVYSAFNYYFQTPNLCEINKETSIELFDDVPSIVTLNLKQWGLFKLLTIESNYKHFSFSQKALIGYKAVEKDDLSLYLADHNNYLSLCGKTIIKGNVKIPSLGPKRAYIEGQSFEGDRLIEGKIEKSEAKLPEIDPQILELNRKYLSGQHKVEDSVMVYEYFENIDTISNSFTNKCLVIKCQAGTVITNKYIIGNVIFISSQSLTISSNSQVSDAVFYASDIKIESNFEGALQAFAINSLEIETNVKLNYPSNLVLLPDETVQGKLTIGENSIVEGSVLLYSVFNMPELNSFLQIDVGALVHGQVYSNQWTELKGEINGSLYANQIILKTLSSVYENHLLNASIDLSKRSKYYIGVDWFKEQGNLAMIKWMY